MVYLAPPFHIVEGVSIFSDHADSLQYYYLPMMPYLSEMESGGISIPSIQLIKYRGDAGNGGFLNFDVNLGYEEERLEEVKRKIRSLYNLSEEPRLAPVPLQDGTVRMMMLGKESGDEIDSDSDEPNFVVQIDHSTKPALYGSNQASFSVQLDEAGVVVLEKTMREGELLPIGIIYSLDYLALRPAYSVTVKAEWDRVQKHLEESFKVKAFIFSSQIDKVVDELIEDKVIELQIDSFIPPGEDAADIKARLDQAVVEVKEMVLENFFEPSLDPIPTSAEKRDGWDKAIHFAERLSHIGAAGGWANSVGFTMKKVDITRIDKKSLNVKMTERTTVKRSIYPQSHLQGLSRIIMDRNLDINRFILDVDLDHPWFSERRVRVISRANFREHDIESLNVRLNYDGHPKNVILEDNRPEEVVHWNTQFEQGQLIRDVKVSYEVAFKDVVGVRRPVVLAAPEETVDVENFEVRPHELYDLLPISIIATENFPWEVYPQVQVEVKYIETEQDIDLNQTFLLSASMPSYTWNIFRLEGGSSDYQYKITYRAADHRDIERNWVTTDDEQITLRDPYPVKRQLDVIAAFNWRDVNMAFVDVIYEDEAHLIRETHSLQFMQGEPIFKTVQIRQFINPRYRFLTYRTTIIYQDGRVKEFLPVMTLEDRVFIRTTMNGRKIVTIQPQDMPFADAGIEEIEVTTRYEDLEAGISITDRFNFRSHQDNPKYFEYDYANPQKSKFEYQLVHFFINGLQRTSEWMTSDERMLIITTE